MQDNNKIYHVGHNFDGCVDVMTFPYLLNANQISMVRY
jgi:hypothetical protein